MRYLALLVAAVSAGLASSSLLASAPHFDRPLGGIRIHSVRVAPHILAFPIDSPPINGFEPKVAMSLTTRQRPQSQLEFTAVASVTRTGNELPNTSNPYLTFATLDSGGQSHILSAADYAAFNVAGSGRAGTHYISIGGASGSEEALISDPLGVFAAGLQDTNAGAPSSTPDTAFVGQYHTSILSAEPGSVLPTILGLPMFAQYSVNIRNSQPVTRTLNGTTFTGPSISLNPLGSSPVYQYRSEVGLQDPNGAALSDPAFIPDLGTFTDFYDNPTTPTFWSFPIIETDISHTRSSRSQQEFLFDTGAQVTVLSEATADAIGFDVDTDTPDFTVEVLGVGGVIQVPGFYMQSLELNVRGGDLRFTNVPVIVLNVPDPRDGIGFVPGIVGMNLFTDRDLTINLDPANPYVSISEAIVPMWNVDNDGNWTTAGNWSQGVPNSAAARANFLGAIHTARTVNVDTAVTLLTARFENDNAYTLAGSGSLRFVEANSQIRVDAGSHRIDVAVNADNSLLLDVNAGASIRIGAFGSAGGNVSKTGAGVAQINGVRAAGLTVTAGELQIIAGLGNASTSKVTSISIGTAGLFDLTDSAVVVDFTSTSPLNHIAHLVANEKITSSLINANTAVGYTTAALFGGSSFRGVAIDSTAVLIAYAQRGDTNLSGNVDFTDLLAVARAFGQTNQFWFNGDSNHDGTVDFSDLLDIARNFGPAAIDSTPFGDEFAGAWSLALSVVPEPATLAVMSFAVMLLGRRRSVASGLS